jgi:hypothetical protein
MKTILAAALMCCAGAAFTQGVIRELNGTVELKPEGTSAFVPARAGDLVALNTIISTGFKSTAVITLGSAVITVQPITRLSLAEISSAWENERLRVNLSTGRIRVNVKPPSGGKTDFTVRSPSATASVRGTEFEFDTWTVQVIEGTVAFSGSHGLMLISAGGSSQVDPVTGRVADPIETSAAALLPPAPAGADEIGGPKDAGPAEVDFNLVVSFD